MTGQLQGDSAGPLFSRYCSQRVVLFILLAFCFQAILLASFRFFSPSSHHFAISSPQTRPSGNVTEKATSGPLCEYITDPSDTLIVVKTGANEIYDKLPTQLLTALACYDDLLIFSDLEQDLGQYHVYDALDNVTEAIKKDDPVFEYYRTLQQYHALGEDISSLKTSMGQAAWNLDKYKFLHMLEKSWMLHPRRKWYVFIEADTYLIRSNLLRWLERLDSSKPFFLGSPTFVNNEAFAHGGSGFVLSGEAMSRFAEGDPGVAARFDEGVQHEQFGDYMLMKALREKGVDFHGVWPMLQAEKPSTIPFGPGPNNGVRHSCQPIVTMHHITPDEASSMWRFEQERHNTTAPLLLEELYRDFVGPHIEPIIEDWYNLSDDVLYKKPGADPDRTKPLDQMSVLEKEAYQSFEHCSRACQEEPRCFQFVYFGDICGFSYSYRFGRRRPPEDDISFRSAWKLAKIAQDQEANPCPSPEWLL